MRSAEELRAESLRLRQTAANVSDPVLKRDHTARAFDLAMRAEVIERSLEDPDLLLANIERYQCLLSANDGKTEAERRFIEEALNDASELLKEVAVTAA